MCKMIRNEAVFPITGILSVWQPAMIVIRHIKFDKRVNSPLHAYGGYLFPMINVNYEAEALISRHLIINGFIQELISVPINAAVSIRNDAKLIISYTGTSREVTTVVQESLPNP